MKNKIKILTLMSALVMAMFSIVGCSGNNTSTDSSVPSDNNSSVSLSELSAEESSEPESSVEISYETTSTAESSVYSDSSAIDPAVEERSYTMEEALKLQNTKFPGFQYQPKIDYGSFGTTDAYYVYTGTSSKVTIPSEFTECPKFISEDVKTVIISETVTKIPKGAFVGCSNLEKLVILNPDCEIEIGAIPHLENSITIKKDLKVYVYYNSDKSPKKSSRFQNDSKCVNFFFGKMPFKEEAERLLDLATESYE